MEIVPGEGLGPIKFGMSPSEVISIMGEKQVYESWMRGNLNDSLVYPGIVIIFDVYNSAGPLANSQVEEFEISESFIEVKFKGLSIFKESKQAIENALTSHSIPYQINEPDISISAIGLALGFNNLGKVDNISFWNTGKKSQTGNITQLQKLDELIRFLETSMPGWPQYFERLEAIRELEQIGDPKAIAILTKITRDDTQEFDAWGLDAGFSMAYFAQEAIKNIQARNQLNPNIEVVASFVEFFKDVPYHVGVVKAAFSRYENPGWDRHWISAKKIIVERKLSVGEPLEIVTVIGGQNLSKKLDEDAYKWLEKMVSDVDKQN
ncbi:MAG: hypothetical protein H6652_05245 [Ardenticatenaceae bacterium]|nr:hypothetical protein [Ardenticatenaceae bacterium]MCB8946588.1 hypothetical protein [Ardenticatenaceae bacterium]